MTQPSDPAIRRHHKVSIRKSSVAAVLYLPRGCLPALLAFDFGDLSSARAEAALSFPLRHWLKLRWKLQPLRRSCGRGCVQLAP